MSAVLEPIVTEAPRSEAPEHVVLYDISWELYEALLAQLNERRMFVTYDDGVMEIMSPSYEHDRGARELGLLITMLAEELAIPMIGIGSTTMHRKDLRKGIEADEAFYFANQKQLHGLRKLDLSKLPAPDLAIEVEISSRLGIRKGIYASLGIPEIWRYDGSTLVIERLQVDQQYVASSVSPTFPTLQIDAVPALIEKAFDTDRISWMRTTREWIRENVLPR